MSVDVKICGILEHSALQAAVEGGARYVGFVFCRSPRHHITPEQAGPLAQEAFGRKVETVGLFEDPTDEELRAIIHKVPLTLLQLHGKETPERVEAVRALTNLRVIKAIHVAAVEDLVDVASYEKVADLLLFDTKIGPMPTGGTGLSFDWSILKSIKLKNSKWMLAGGLDINNIAQAVAMTGTRIIDLSSGVEDAPGHKSPEKIRALLEAAKSLPQGRLSLTATRFQRNGISA